MAFERVNSSDPLKVYFWVGCYFGGNENLKLWIYLTTDAATTVDGSAYITDAEMLEVVDVGDLILSYQVSDRDDLSAGITDISLHAVLVNDGSVIDLSDDLLGATVTYGD